MPNKQPVLCYVDGQWAYFTTQSLSEQWGDDWDDAPYEHNSGKPYEFGEHEKRKGRKPWQIIKAAWDGDFVLPCDDYINSPWSVEQINAGAIAWLRTHEGHAGEPVIIPAGTTLNHFCELVHEGGGEAYLSPASKGGGNGRYNHVYERVLSKRGKLLSSASRPGRMAKLLFFPLLYWHKRSSV